MTLTINCKATIEIEEILQNALTEVAKLDPHMSVDWQDCGDYLSEEDKADLAEILAKHERGEIECLSSEEFKQKRVEFFKKLGVDESKIL